MDIKLVVANGKNAGKEILIQVPQFLVGRAEGCHLRPTTQQVSPRHCAVLSEEGKAFVQDLGSATGTFVNQKKVVGRQELKTGDRLKIGPLEFEVQLIVGVGGKKKSKVRSVQEAAARTVQASANEDLDVSQWLTKTEPAAEAFRGSEEPSGEKAEKDEAKSTAEDESGSSLFGPGHGQQKPKTVDSREAAAEVLKRMFGKD